MFSVVSVNLYSGGTVPWCTRESLSHDILHGGSVRDTPPPSQTEQTTLLGTSHPLEQDRHHSRCRLRAGNTPPTGRHSCLSRWLMFFFAFFNVGTTRLTRGLILLKIRTQCHVEICKYLEQFGNLRLILNWKWKTALTSNQIEVFAICILPDLVDIKYNFLRNIQCLNLTDWIPTFKHSFRDFVGYFYSRKRMKQYFTSTNKQTKMKKIPYFVQLLIAKTSIELSKSDPTIFLV